MYKNCIAMKLPMQIFKKPKTSQIFWGIRYLNPTEFQECLKTSLPLHNFESSCLNYITNLFLRENSVFFNGD